MKYAQTLIKAFPNDCEKEIRSLFHKVKLIAEHEMHDSFAVTLENERLHIPYRIYFKEVSEDNLNENELILLNCIFTRHHNGFIRQKSLEKIISSEKLFVTPFVFQLLGEYVVQIIDVINDNLNERMIENMKMLAEENPAYLQLTKQRIMSYWSCYYRSYSSKKEDYVGFKVLNKLNL